MRISFHGAARNVTGSKHLISLSSGTKLLLDCGMFQGMGPETDEMNKQFGFEPTAIDYVLLSHAHIDHSGLVPLLVKGGFRGRILCTPATRDLCAILLADSARIQEQDAKYSNKRRRSKGLPPVSPLYTESDSELALSLFEVIDYNIDYRISDEVSVTFTDAGHIIGSASISLRITENSEEYRLTFSGDVGRYNDLILKSPESFPPAEYIILESTYGDSLHKEAEPPVRTIRDIIHQTCVERGGKVIIPAFSVGRTQEIIYSLNMLEEQGELPDVKYFVDSPLSVKATRVVMDHPENFNSRVQELMINDEAPFDFKGLKYIEDLEESKSLNFLKEPCVIISSSGMAEAGRVKHHIKNNIEDERNTILIVGYCEPRSLGGRLLAGAEEVSIFGDKFPVIASVRSIRSMSAHGDYEDLLNFMSAQDPSSVKKVFLVHGEFAVQQAFRSKLISHGFNVVEIPERHQEFAL